MIYANLLVSGVFRFCHLVFHTASDVISLVSAWFDSFTSAVYLAKTMPRVVYAPPSTSFPGRAGLNLEPRFDGEDKGLIVRPTQPIPARPGKWGGDKAHCVLCLFCFSGPPDLNQR